MNFNRFSIFHMNSHVIQTPINMIIKNYNYRMCAKYFEPNIKNIIIEMMTKL